MENIYKSNTLCILPDSEPTKLLYHPKQKYRGGHTDKHLPPSTFTRKFLRKADIGFGFFTDIWSMIQYVQNRIGTVDKCVLMLVNKNSTVRTCG